MDDQHKNFSVWLFRPEGWEEGDAGRMISGGFDEPAEAADLAESTLEGVGVENQSYCELRFNGDPKPHTVICYLGANHYGIWNTEIVRWPIFYPDHGGNQMLGDFPFEIMDDGNTWEEKDEAESKQKSDDEGDMRLDEIPDNDDLEDDEGDEDDSDEGEQDEEVQPDDEETDDEIEDDESDDEAPDDDEDGEDEAEEDDDEDSDKEDDEDDEQEESEKDFNSDEDDEEEGEDEDMKLPRLPIFAKMRGPLGWRKRAQAEELQEKNTFALKVGILDEEAEKSAQQEREVFLEVVFIETDEDRSGGLLRMKLPEGVMIEDFSERTKAGWVSLHIPYRQEGDE